MAVAVQTMESGTMPAVVPVPRSTECVPAQERPQALPALTGLRFFAALLVVVHHYCLSWRYSVLPLAHAGPLHLVEAPLVALVGAGHMGVSLFFVLSGFILAYGYVDRGGRLRGSPRAFWAARLARVYPLYLAAFCLAGVFVVRDHTTFDHPVATLWGGLLLLQAWLPGAAVAWNPPGWSLSAEALFYVLFPFVLPRLLACCRERLWSLWLLCWALAALPVLSYWALGHGAQPWQDLAYWSPPARLPEFVLGAVTCRLWQSGRLGVPRATVALCFLALLAGMLLLPDALLRAGTLDPLFALLVVALAGGRGRLAALCATPLLLVLGEASYALYLLHWPLLQGLAALAPWLARTGLAGLLCAVGLGVAASLLSWRCLETPARRAIRARWGAASVVRPRAAL